ncbi:PadR family transcriptional regulator [Williamsia sp. R60]
MRLIDRSAVRLHILGRATKEAISEQQMTEELARHQYRLSATDLHTSLDELVKEGLLNADHRLIDGHQQWIYRGTPSGRMELARDLRALSKLSHEVFGDALPAAPLDMETVPQDHSVLGGGFPWVRSSVEPSGDNEGTGWEFGYR